MIGFVIIKGDSMQNIELNKLSEVKKYILDGNVRGLSYIGFFLKKCGEKEFYFTALENNCDSLEAVKDTIEELKEVPFYLKENCPYTFEQIREISEGTIKLLYTYFVGQRNVELQANSDELNKYFLRSLLYLKEKNYHEALRCLNIYDSYGEIVFRSYPHLFYYRGLAYYGLGEYDEAQKDWFCYQQAVPADELVYFHLGNTFLRKDAPVKALDNYISALEIHHNFPEVMANAEIIRQYYLSDNKMHSSDAANVKPIDGLTSILEIPTDLDIYEIPIFINNFNRLGCLKKLVDWLISAGYHRIFILDNASTYQPLLEYYKLFNNDNDVCVIQFDRNWGYKALWHSGILELLNVESPYVYTDSDVLPVDGCPKDVLCHLLNILRRYPFLKKVGLGLVTNDITCVDAEKIKEIEKRYYLHQMEENVYFGAVDTTFALYRNYRHYNLYVSARTTGNCMAYHLPWYYDYKNLPDDERYYAEHANNSASFIQKLKKEKILS